MKKLLVAMCLCIAAICSANAQDVTFWYGLNLAKTTGDLKSDSHLKPLNIGFTYNSAIDEMFGWSVGASYVTKGGKYNATALGHTLASKEWAPSFIQLDAFATCDVYNANDFKFGFLAGPYLGYMINDDVDNNDDDDNGFNDFDFGIGIGAKAAYKQFSLKVGYEFGLTNYLDSDNFSSKFNGLYFRLGYSF